jgi:hypothetical protein
MVAVPHAARPLPTVAAGAGKSRASVLGDLRQFGVRRAEHVVRR